MWFRRWYYRATLPGKRVGNVAHVPGLCPVLEGASPKTSLGEADVCPLHLAISKRAQPEPVVGGVLRREEVNLEPLPMKWGHLAYEVSLMV